MAQVLAVEHPEMHIARVELGARADDARLADEVWFEQSDDQVPRRPDDGMHHSRGGTELSQH